MSRPGRTMKGGYTDGSSLPKGPSGRNLCRWCNLEVPTSRRTFCSPYCVHEWHLRTDPSYLRDCVFDRDRGVCARCGIDAQAEWARIRRLHYTKRRAALAAWGLQRITRRSLWDADHIIPVAEGGGECDLDNIRTLCLRCHRVATSELREKLRSLVDFTQG